MATANEQIWWLDELNILGFEQTWLIVAYDVLNIFFKWNSLYFLKISQKFIKKMYFNGSNWKSVKGWMSVNQQGSEGESEGVSKTASDGLNE